MEEGGQLLPSFIRRDEMKTKIVLALSLSIFLVGCAGEQVVKDTRTFLHFVTFKTEPVGVDVVVIDTSSGKEVGYLGKTPIRVLLMKNTVQVGRLSEDVTCTDIVTSPNTIGVMYGKTKVEGVEFQFKLRADGYRDEIKIERIPVINLSDSDVTMNIALQRSN